MTRPTSHPPGTFAWADLRTDDPASAKRFYGDLFDWRYTSDTYAVACIVDDAVSGLKPLAGDQHTPFWLSYVTVRDADAAVSRTRELGGTVRRGPFQTDAGRMTVIADPTGGSLCLWESAEGIGACRLDQPGCLTRHELRTAGVAAAGRFYHGLFGWRVEQVGRYDQPVAPARWLPYFAVASLDETVTRVEQAGGQVVERRSGSVLSRDPQGAEFGVLDPRTGR